jgi:hypothetical protein
VRYTSHSMEGSFDYCTKQQRAVFMLGTGQDSKFFNCLQLLAWRAGANTIQQSASKAWGGHSSDPTNLVLFLFCFFNCKPDRKGIFPIVWLNARSISQSLLRRNSTTWHTVHTQ